MVTTRNRNYKDEFIKSLKCEDPKTLLEIWHNRSNDDFYSTLEELKCLTDKHFPSETNPLLFVMMAYCFDGDRHKSVDKVRSILGSLVNEENSYDDVITKFVDLEIVAECDESKTLIELNKKVAISDYYDLVISGFDTEYGIKGRNLRVVPKDNSLLFYFDAYGDEDDLQWLKDNLFIKIPGEDNFMKRVITFSLRDKVTEQYYDLFYLSECYPISFMDNIDRNETITLEFESFEQFFASECNIQIIEDIKNTIEKKLNSLGCEIEECEGELPPLSEKSTTLDMSKIGGMKFRLQVCDTDEVIYFDNLKLSYNSNSDFTFKLNNIDLNENSLSNNLLFHLNAFDEARGMVSKKDIVKDMKIDLYDLDEIRVESKVHNITELKNAYVISYDVNDKTNTASIEIVCETFFIDDQDDDQVANYVRDQLSNVMTDLYRDLSFNLNRPWNEYA